jgi:hypothetical protein
MGRSGDPAEAFSGSAGVELRYCLSKQHPLNHRIDYAYGKDGRTPYFAVGEAF